MRISRCSGKWQLRPNRARSFVRKTDWSLVKWGSLS